MFDPKDIVVERVDERNFRISAPVHIAGGPVNVVIRAKTEEIAREVFLHWLETQNNSSN